MRHLLLTTAVLSSPTNGFIRPAKSINYNRSVFAQQQLESIAALEVKAKNLSHKVLSTL